MVQYNVYLKDLNVVIERNGVIYRFIPTREFRIQPETDFILLEGAGFEKNLLYSQIQDETGTPIGGIQEVIDYLSPFVGFKNGGGTGNGGTSFLSGKVLTPDDLPQPPSDYTGQVYEAEQSVGGVVLPVVGRIGGKDAGLYKSDGTKWYKMPTNELDVTEIGLDPSILQNTDKVKLSDALKDYDTALETEKTTRQTADTQLQQNINNEATARQNADEGSVSIHSDMDTTNSNGNEKQVLVNDGNDIYKPRTLNLDDNDDVNTQNITPEDGWILKFRSGEYVPCMRKVISSADLEVNNDDLVTQQKISTSVNFQRAGYYIFEPSFNWSIDATNSDFIATLLVGGVKVVTLPNTNEILRKEGKDSTGNNGDGRGTSAKETFNNKYLFLIDSPGPRDVELTFNPEAFFVEASCWNATIIIEEEFNPQIIN